MARPLVIYHASCMDGLAAAWACREAMKEQMRNPKFMACNYGDPIPDLSGKDVFLLDFTFDDIEGFRAKAPGATSIKVLDHHKGPHETWQQLAKEIDNLEYIYDANQSGCMIAWQYFHPDKYDIPALLRIIEDRDLWKFELPDTREVFAYVCSFGLLKRPVEHTDFLELFERFGKHVEAYEKDRRTAPQQGAGILRERNSLMDAIIERNSFIAEWPEYGPKEDDPETLEVKGVHMVPVCEAPYEMASDIAEKLYTEHEDAPFAVVYESRWKTGQRKYSIRSHKTRGINVLPIAQAEGGSGHEHAAGWLCPIEQEFPWYK